MHDAERLYALLDRLGVVLRADDRQVGGQGALQPIHRALLRYLARCNRYSDTPGAAATYLGQTKGTVSQSLGVLERRGYVKKRRDARDRRVIRLELTAKGRRAAGEEPGTPSVTSGINDAGAQALFAISDAVTPRRSPLPYWLLSLLQRTASL